MGHDIRNFRQLLALLRQLWRETRGFFLSIELWMMIALSWTTVAAFWLAFMGDVRSLAVFGLLLAYVGARIILHVRQILHWPFL